MTSVRVLPRHRWSRAACRRAHRRARRRLQDRRDDRQVDVAEGRRTCCREILQALQGGRVRRTSSSTGRCEPVQLAARLQGGHGRERGQVRDRRPGHASSTRPRASSPPYIIGLPFPTIDGERSRRRRQDPVEPLLPHLVLREPLRGVADQLGEPDRARAPRRRAGEASPTTTASRRTSFRRRTRRASSTGSCRSVVGPADLNGTAALTWRYRDSDEARLRPGRTCPALRRVRATSPGEPLRRLPRLRREPGRRPVLRRQGRGLRVEARRRARCSSASPRRRTSRARRKRAGSSGKGWDTDWPRRSVHRLHGPELEGRRVGADRGCDARRSAASGSSRARRSDKYYLYGKIQLYIDKITFQGAWSRKFGWKGELLAIHQVMGWNPIPFTASERQGRLQPGLQPGLSDDREHQAQPRHRRRHPSRVPEPASIGRIKIQLLRLRRRRAGQVRK